MIQIAPSILAAFLHLEKDVELVNREADLFHLDIMDGSFVPNISFGFPVVEAIAKAARKPLDVHLMIVHPEKYVERFARAGAAMLSFHYEAALEDSGAILEQIQALGVKAGIVINPDCPENLPILGQGRFCPFDERFRRLRGAEVHTGVLRAHRRRPERTGPPRQEGGSH